MTDYRVAPAAGPYTNRLIHESSPYLQEHAHNPVDWQAWGAAALAQAQAEDKPILLSIGYRSCHWCNVMARESFEDPETAALMNAYFVCIKVDREERPDIDSLYMSALQAMNGQGGWPLNVFLLPDGAPFYGGTYFPPDAKAARYRMPSFKQVLQSIAEAYRTRRDELREAGQTLVSHVAAIATSMAPLDEGVPELDEMLTSALASLAERFDAHNGGFGNAPKFPQPMSLEFLLRMAYRRNDQTALGMLTHTLRKMAEGGIYDHVGGGFHRYSVDAIWLVPHFEKMLYDNALLARLYAETYQLTNDPFFRQIAEATLDYMLREMRHPSGGFFSTQDADSLPSAEAAHAEEGAFFVWSPSELREILGADSTLFCAIYNVTERGNFEGRTILSRPRPLEVVAKTMGTTVERLQAVSERCLPLLFAARAKRLAPFRDEKILTAWNGMALRALVVAAAACERPDYTEAAQTCANFLLSEMRRPDGRLMRSWKDGQRAPVLGFLEDCALLIDGLLALHGLDGDLRWLREANKLADEMIAGFWDTNLDGFYDTAHDHEQLVTRPRDVSDNATPSGNSVATEVLLRLGAITGLERYREFAERVLMSHALLMGRFAAGFGRLLCAADLASQPIRELAIIGESDDPATQALCAVALQTYRPEVVLARSRPDDHEAAALTPLLAERPLVAGRPTAYLCEQFVCRQPVTAPADLAVLLG